MKTSSIVSKKTSPYFKGLRAASDSTAAGALTVVLVPGDRYTDLAETAESLPTLNEGAIRFIIVDGDAPDPVKRRLEKSARDRAACKILYSHHRPTVTEAINMAAVHVATPYVFFLSADIRFTAGDLDGLLRALKQENADIVQPVFNGAKKPAWRSILVENGTPFIDPRALLMTTACLNRLGALEECDWRISGIDLALTAQRSNLKFITTNEMAVESRGTSLPVFPEDQELKNIQWNPSSSKISLQKVGRKWNLNFSENHYLQTVTSVRSSNISGLTNTRKSPLARLRTGLKWRSHLYWLISYVKITFKSGAASKTGSPRGMQND